MPTILKRELSRTALGLALVVTVALGGLLTLPLQAGAQEAPIPAAAQSGALSIAAQQLGMSESSLVVVGSRTVELSATAVTVYTFKIATSDGNSVAGVTVDANGVEQDLDALLAAEKAASGGSVPTVFSKVLAGASADDLFHVALWIKTPFEQGFLQRPVPRSEPSREQLDEIFREVDARRAQRVAAATRGVRQRLQALGRSFEAAEHAPMLVTHLTADEIRDLAEANEVLRIQPVTRFESSADVLLPTINGHLSQQRGLDGTGVQVAAIEVGGQVATANPFLGCVEQDTTFSCLDPHATAVAGVLCSDDFRVRGVAPATRLWMGGSCFGFGDELMDRTDAAVTWGARVLNLSYGADFEGFVSEFDAFYDDLVINGSRTVVAAAGNNAAFGGYVNTPATAYNVITVGSYDDQGSVTWLDDAISTFSSWKDPMSTNADREKPELVAPGTAITSTTNSAPWTGSVGDGTSWSTPAVAGGAALLMQRDSTLEAWPEIVKSILMATAVHNVEGDARLSDFDGAGGVDLDRADDIARSRNGDWGGVSYSCLSSTFLTVESVYLSAGDRLRAVIAWDNDPAYSLYDTQPSADLDLRLYDPWGFIVTRSVSYDNTYEVVDYVATLSGYHDVVVVKFRCDSSPRWLGWAVHTVD